MHPVESGAPATPPPSFAEHFCRRFHCAAGQFEQRLFWRCVPLLGRLPVLAMSLLVPGYFSRELRFARRAGAVRHMADLRLLANSLRWHPELSAGTPRRWLGARLSGRRLLRLGAELLPDDAGDEVPPS